MHEAAGGKAQRKTTVIQRVLAPYLTGKGLPGRAHRVVALPTQAQLQRVLANRM